MSGLKKSNIDYVVEMVRKATEISSKQAFAVQVYLHAVMHKTDPTAVAAGLMAAKFADKEKITLPPPVDCIVGHLVSQFGFDTVASWTDQQWKDNLESFNPEIAETKAITYIKEDAAVVAAQKLRNEENAMDAMMGVLSKDSTKH
jgi:hypothetical protein